MEYDTLKVESKEGIVTLVINRPKAYNALNSAFFADLEKFIDTEACDSSVKVLIITGEGKAFAAGADISEMADLSPDEAAVFSKTGQDILLKLENLDIPVIAAVNGYALGGGCELALACDIRVADRNAKFGQPEVKLGLVPGFGGTMRLPRIAGLSNSLYMLMSGEMVSADDARIMGIVQIVTEPGEVLAEAEKLAGIIAAMGPEAVKKVKRLARKGLFSEFNEGSRRETTEFAPLFGGEGKKGMRAFLEKRKPEWQ